MSLSPSSFAADAAAVVVVVMMIERVTIDYPVSLPSYAAAD